MDQLFFEPCLFSGLMLANSSHSHLLDVALKCFQNSTPSVDSTQPLSYIEIATLYTDRATRPVPRRPWLTRFAGKWSIVRMHNLH
jgi:hypothetical protein